jgi:hypothetical protein
MDDEVRLTFLKYIPITELDNINAALNFETVDCRIEGSCDVYTTKAAGSDKKLYKNIEHTLESQYESLLRFSASLSPPEAITAAPSLNLSRSSPFGPLSQISSRRTFAYLIATLNASHPDYDFSYNLKPSDFRRERSLRSVMNTLDTTLFNLQPKPPTFNGPPHWTSEITPASGITPNPTQKWGPRMWRAIDKEMDLKECSIYTYRPDEDPYDEEEGVIWSFDYFFFNKIRKRVCYIYLRGLSIISAHSQTPAASVPRFDITANDWNKESGAQKRAKFWLGERGSSVEVEGGWDEDDDDELLALPSEQGRQPRLLSRHERQPFKRTTLEGSPFTDRSRSKSTVRALSEEIADLMEV